jgi:hypothetical protein
MDYIDCIFFKHPRENKMTYNEHFKFSSFLSCLFCSASCQACIHSLFPYCFESSSSDYNKLVGEYLEIKHIPMMVMKR